MLRFLLGVEFFGASDDIARVWQNIEGSDGEDDRCDIPGGFYCGVRPVSIG
jgi:hypothetical protein